MVSDKIWSIRIGNTLSFKIKCQAKKNSFQEKKGQEIYIIGLDKSGYQANILLAEALLMSTQYYPQHMLPWRRKKNINTFGLKKASYQEL